MCIAGYGKAQGSSLCTPCAYGFYQPGGLTTCQACPTTPFYAPVDGAGDTYVSDGTTTYPTSHGAEACVPKQSQLSPEAGQAYIAPGSSAMSLLSSAPAPTLKACLDSCPAGQCCLAQYDVTGKLCYSVALAPVAASAAGQSLVYKLPPSTLGSASSLEEPAAVKGKTMSSGYYAHCAIPTASAAAWAGAGTGLGADARTFVQGGAQKRVVSDRAECKKLCDDSNVCWGFVFDSADSSCSFRGGVDALATRSFFALPSGVELAQFQW